MHDLPRYYSEKRPWGGFDRFTLNEPSTVKVLSVASGEALSLQTHKKRDEFWRVIDGSGIVTVREDKKNAEVGDEFWIPRGVKHRAEGGPGGIRILEISLGESDEGDIERLEDRYGRT